MSGKHSADAAISENAQRYLAFSLGKESFLVPLSSVREVIEVPEITPVPKTPPYYLGVMNLRGQVVSVVDLRHKLKGLIQEHAKNTVVVIIDFGSFLLGILVGTVNRVMAFDKGEIQDRPPMETAESLDYVSGVAYRDKVMYLLLNVGKALSVEDIQVIVDQKTA